MAFPEHRLFFIVNSAFSCFQDWLLRSWLCASRVSDSVFGEQCWRLLSLSTSVLGPPAPVWESGGMHRATLSGWFLFHLLSGSLAVSLCSGCCVIGPVPKNYFSAVWPWLSFSVPIPFTSCLLAQPDSLSFLSMLWTAWWLANNFSPCLTESISRVKKPRPLTGTASVNGKFRSSAPVLKKREERREYTEVG